jgi:hypothetical protein
MAGFVPLAEEVFAMKHIVFEAGELIVAIMRCHQSQEGEAPCRRLR